MNVLIVFAHPNPESFSHALVNQIKNLCQKNGIAQQSIDLYQENFDAILRPDDFAKTSNQVLYYQSLIQWADRLVFAYPIWWGQMPALLKGFFDKVFSFGFAYKNGEDGNSIGLLGNKKIYFLVNFGMDKESQQKSGIEDAVYKLHLLNNFSFCGIDEKDCKINYLYSVPKLDAQQRQKYLDEVENWFFGV